MERDGIVGSVWTWTAIDADTKLIPCWLIGTRDAGCATEFIQDLAGRHVWTVEEIVSLMDSN